MPFTALDKADVLLVEHRDISDPETGGSYTVRLYERISDDEVQLRPDTDVDGFEPIVLHAEDGDVRVVAEIAEVLPGHAG